jgi:hypothetical protein
MVTTIFDAFCRIEAQIGRRLTLDSDRIRRSRQWT